MNVELDIVNGNHDGNILYAVSFLNDEDIQSSTAEIYRAFNINDLKEQVKLIRIGDENNYAENDENANESFQMDEENFNRDWSLRIISTEIGEIKY